MALNGELNLKCCCKDLLKVNEERLRAVEDIADHWKVRTKQLVGKYYNSLQSVRED